IDLGDDGSLTVDGAVLGSSGEIPGTIDIRGRSIKFSNGPGILGGCYYCSSKVGDPDRPPDAGIVRISATEDLVFSGSGVRGATNGTGAPGASALQAGALPIGDGSKPNAGPWGPGAGGTITVR